MTLQTIDPDAVHYVDLVREIVAWFDVIDAKMPADAFDLAADWPTDWLARARKALSPSEGAKT